MGRRRSQGLSPRRGVSGIAVLVAVCLAVAGLPVVARAQSSSIARAPRRTRPIVFPSTLSDLASWPTPPTEQQAEPVPAPLDENTSEDANAQGSQFGPPPSPSPSLAPLAATSCSAAPTLSSPANGITIEGTSPVLKVSAIPTGCDVVRYKVYADPGLTKVVKNFGWTDARSFSVPAGYLFDGQTYFWTVESDAICFYPVSPCNQSSYPTSASRSFSIQLKHLGTDSRWVMWSHDLGNNMSLSVNQATGNLFLKVPLGSLDTIADPLRFGLSYNSQATKDDGVGPGWRLYMGADSGGGMVPVQLREFTSSDQFKLTLESGRPVYFSHLSGPLYESPGAFGGSLRVKNDVDPTTATATKNAVVYTSPTGDVYTFDSHGDPQNARVSVSRNLSATSAASDFSYTFDSNDHLTKVTDPSNRTVNLTWQAGSVTITDWASRTWTLSLSAGVVQSAAITYAEDGTNQTNKVQFSYNGNGLLNQVQNGEQVASAKAGWSINYMNDTAPPQSVFRVSKLTPPGAPAADYWFFDYTDFSGAALNPSTVVKETDLTDPRGNETSGTTDPTDDYMTKTFFNFAGLPIAQHGPRVFASSSDASGFMPIKTWGWDTNDNLLCVRTPAANEVSKLCTTDTTVDPPVVDFGQDGLSTRYDYSDSWPFRRISETSPAPNADGTGAKRFLTYTYDGGPSFNGLWLDRFDNANAVGAPAKEGMWSDFSCPSSNPCNPLGASSTAGFSLRWSGVLHITTQDRYFFKFTSATNDGMLLAVDDEVLFDCFGGTWSGQNCDGSNVSKVLWPGDRHITIMLSHPGTGGSSFLFQWNEATNTGGVPSTFNTIQPVQTDPNLALLTSKLDGPQNRTVGTQPQLQTDYDYSTDLAKSRRLPAAISLTDVNSSARRKTDYAYDAATGQMKSETLPAPGGNGASATPIITYQYTDTSNPACLTKTERRAAAAAAGSGAVTTYTCNASGYVTDVKRQAHALDQEAAFTQETIKTRDALGHVVKKTLPSGEVIIKTFDLAGRLKKTDVLVASGVHAITDYTYDQAGRLKTTTLPDPGATETWGGSTNRPVVTYTYDWADNQLSRTDPRNPAYLWLSQYDAMNRMASTTTPEGNTTQTWYRLHYNSTSGTLLDDATSIDPAGVHTVTNYDILGRSTDITTSAADGTNPIGPESYVYDVMGNRTKSRRPAPSGSGTIDETSGYDAFGETTSDTVPTASGLTPSTATTSYSFNADGQLYLVQGPRTDVNDQIKYTYDVQGNLDTAQLPGLSDQNTWNFDYNDLGELVQLSSPLSSNTAYASSASELRQWTYDATGLLKSASIGSGAGVKQTTTYAYNLAGWLTSSVDPRSVVKGTTVGTEYFSYDNLGNLVERYNKATSTAAKTFDETYQYDQDANRTKAVEVGGPTTTLTYDKQGRTQTVTQGTSSTTYTYDQTAASMGRLYSITDPAGTTYFAYDTNGLLKKVDDPFTGAATPFGGVITSYGYDEAGRLTSRTDPAGLSWSRTYDLRSGEVTTQSVTEGAITQFSETWGYDVAGNVTSDYQSVNGGAEGTWTYTYDAANRLSTASLGGTTTTYLYDGQGDRVSTKTGAAAAVTTLYDSRGIPVSSSDGTAYTFDNAGNLTKVLKGTATTTYGYDSWNRMVKATVGSSTSIYAYDGLGRMTSSGPSTSPTTFAYQGESSQAVTETIGASTTAYSFTPYGPLAERQVGVSGSLRYFLKDLHGDVVGLIAQQGAAPSATVSYSPYGEVASSSGTWSGSLGFQGQRTDPSTSLLLTDTRAYAPWMGRFDTADILFGDPTSPMSMNSYVYATDSPITFTDPTGMAPPCEPGMSNCLAYWSDPDHIGTESTSGDGGASDGGDLPPTFFIGPVSLDLWGWLGGFYDVLKGLRRYVSGMGRALRQGDSNAARYLPVLGRLTRFVETTAFEVAGDVLVLLGAAADLSEELRQGQSPQEALARTGLKVGGAVGGFELAGAACVALGAATEGVGFAVCALGAGSGGVAGWWLGGQAGGLLPAQDADNQLQQWMESPQFCGSGISWQAIGCRFERGPFGF